MRKILFVAKMNETAKNLNAALVKYYQVLLFMITLIKLQK